MNVKLQNCNWFLGLQFYRPLYLFHCIYTSLPLVRRLNVTSDFIYSKTKIYSLHNFITILRFYNYVLLYLSCSFCYFFIIIITHETFNNGKLLFEEEIFRRIRDSIKILI